MRPEFPRFVNVILRLLALVPTLQTLNLLGPPVAYVGAEPLWEANQQPESHAAPHKTHTGRGGSIPNL